VGSFYSDFRHFFFSCGVFAPSVFRTEFLRLRKPFTSAAKAGQSASLDRSAGSAAPPKIENL